MTLEFKRDKERKGAVHYSLGEEVLSEGVEVRAFTADATLMVKNLDEITGAKELVMALWQHCEVQVATAAVRLRKGPTGTQMPLVQLLVVNASKFVKVGKLKMGWSVCHLNLYEPPEICFRYLKPRHRSGTGASCAQGPRPSLDAAQ